MDLFRKSSINHWSCDGNYRSHSCSMGLKAPVSQLASEPLSRSASQTAALLPAFQPVIHSALSHLETCSSSLPACHPFSFCGGNFPATRLLIFNSLTCLTSSQQLSLPASKPSNPPACFPISSSSPRQPQAGVSQP